MKKKTAQDRGFPISPFYDVSRRGKIILDLKKLVRKKGFLEAGSRIANKITAVNPGR